VHPRPSEAFSDGAQSLKPERFAKLMDEIRPLVELMGMTLEPAKAAAAGRVR
jgi:3-deoxy-7-phosphoheptulonate synthase